MIPDDARRLVGVRVDAEPPWRVVFPGRQPGADVAVGDQDRVLPALGIQAHAYGRRLDMDAVGNEVHTDAAVGQDRFDAGHRPDAEVGLGLRVEHVVEVGGVAGTGGDGLLRLGQGRAGVRDEHAGTGRHQRLDHRNDVLDVGADRHARHAALAGSQQLAQQPQIAGDNGAACAGERQERALQVHTGHAYPRHAVQGLARLGEQLQERLAGLAQERRVDAGAAIGRQTRRRPAQFRRPGLVAEVVNAVRVNVVRPGVTAAVRVSGPRRQPPNAPGGLAIRPCSTRTRRR